MITIRRPLFILNCEPSLEPHGNWLADIIESRLSPENQMNDGNTIQVGWAVFKLIRINDELQLCEPYFVGNALVNFRPTVSTSLMILQSQTSLLSRVGSDGQDVRYDDKVTLQKGCLSNHRIFAERGVSEQGDSGWFFGCANPEEPSAPLAPSDLETILSYELIFLRPSALAAMALPSGWLISWNGNEIEAVADHEDRNVLPSHT